MTHNGKDELHLRDLMNFTFWQTHFKLWQCLFGQKSVIRQGEQIWMAYVEFYVSKRVLICFILPTIRRW